MTISKVLIIDLKELSKTCLIKMGEWGRKES